MQASLQKIEHLQDSITTFWFKPGGRFRYIAGEFTEMYIPHAADDRGDKRWFTLSSSPTEPLLGITTSFSEPLGSSFKKALRALQPGDMVRLAEPMGDFVLPKDPSIPLVFVAGGLGITPVRSIIKSLVDSGQRRFVRLLHIASPAKAHLFDDVFTAYGEPVEHMKSSTSSSEALAFTLQVAELAATATPNTMFYLAGPKRLIQHLVDILAKNGIDARQIVTDFFPGYTTL